MSVSWTRSITSGRVIGYAAALVVPVALTYLWTSLNLPAFVFEHLVILLVLAVAIPWGLGPAVVAALVSVGSDNVLLRDPIGRPTISGYRDLIDLLMFATVAVVVSGLVTRAHAARLAAQHAADRERRAREERDRLVATITHDLATPLSVLGGTIQFARAQGAAQADWSRLLSRLETASARAMSLVRMLGDAQALDEEAPPFALATHDLRAIVAPIVQMMDRFSDRHPVLLSMPEEPISILADPDRLQRVFENLVNNAIKYSPHGGAVEISLVREGLHAVVRVRDHGIGISQDALPHIFERSFRAPEATAHAPGLGLGLSIAAQVLAKHGGSIAVAPGEGCGTCVIVRLPVAPLTLHSPDGKAATETVRGL